MTDHQCDTRHLYCPDFSEYEKWQKAADDVIFQLQLNNLGPIEAVCVLHMAAVKVFRVIFADNPNKVPSEEDLVGYELFIRQFQQELFPEKGRVQ